jgi:hypothetical protein
LATAKALESLILVKLVADESILLRSTFTVYLAGPRLSLTTVLDWRRLAADESSFVLPRLAINLLGLRRPLARICVPVA